MPDEPGMSGSPPDCGKGWFESLLRRFCTKQKAPIAKLEKRIAKVYEEARDELDETVKAYFASFEKRDAERNGRKMTTSNGG